MSDQRGLNEILETYGVSSVNEKGADGWTALMNAVLDCDKRAATVLLDNGADLEIKDSDKRTALFITVDYQIRSMVELLLERGADINTRNNRGVTPLEHAREREIIYKGTATGEHFAAVAKQLEVWPELQKQRSRPDPEIKGLLPPPRPGKIAKHWQI